MKYEPYTTYQYYKNLHEVTCKACNSLDQNHLLRYRTYLLAKYPIIPTRNFYYSVCTNCGHYYEVEDELLLMKLLQAARKIKPLNYTNFSFKEHQQHQEFNIENTIKLHLKMM
jgi:transcription elongation factor Elf1